MSGDFYNPNDFTPPDNDPYNNKAVRYRRIGNGARSRYIPIHEKNESLDFDPRVDYVSGAIQLREQVLAAFDQLREIAQQPSAIWKSADRFHKPTGSLIHNTRLIVDTVEVSEHVVVAVHEHQHLIDEAKALRADFKRLEDATPQTERSHRGLAYIWAALNRPVKL
jgi:hypothetical protein